MSRSIDDLHPELAKRYMAFANECEHQNIDYMVTCTWRSIPDQNELYAQGRTKPGRIVTWARGGESSHNFTIGAKPASLAFDICAIRHDKLVWSTKGNGLDSDPLDDETDDLELWQRLGLAGKSVGLVWAGDWSVGKREFPHFELPNAKQIREA